MHRFTDLLLRFGRDERGVFAVVFSVMAIVLIALGGAVVDYVRLEQTRNRAQVALDAAALALQPEIFKKPLHEADIKAKAQALIQDRVGSEGLGGDEITSSVEIARADVVNGSLYLEGKINVPTAFVRLVGVNNLGATFFAEATRKMLNLEVAMVLDNSGSMQQNNRMAYLKTAATCATNILFFDDAVDEDTCEPLVGAASSDKVKIGIIPFTTMVNIGTQFANASWLDWSGQSSIAKLNFDNDDYDGNNFDGLVDRKALFTKTNTAWRGCVEARLAPNDTTDEPAVNSSAKFVPFFVPDGHYGTSSSYISDTGGTCAIDKCTKTVEYGWGGNTTNHKRQVGNVTTNFGAASLYRLRLDASFSHF
ncbi:TadE/TadG family type IV pilus assembly protein [Devosia sp. RR2S18]|uniref:TadE/TadG family type IV pilus assembly protein n=1 Tax=Devosia rhizosphaerae TaxID=3049774 RepID=UPI00253F6C00|nr:pilus assembly protein TadG-related protein [Devosia sp. RR2S18]WIJ24670.1 pilus assembly protein TadG-related protein [Devosia sp. RR2S18]